MSREQIRLDAGRTVTVAIDDEPPLGARTWGIVSLRLIDEMSGDPPRSLVTVETGRAGLMPRIEEDGLVGLVGFPRNIFPALAVQSYSLSMTVRATDYLPHSIEATLNSNPAFPTLFSPVILPDLPLHRAPVLIRGRMVFGGGATITPIAGATVQLIGLWRTPPPANVVVPPVPPTLLALQSPLYFARTGGVSRVRRRNLTPIVGQDKRLLAATLAGSQELLLSDQVNLVVGSILLIDADQPDITEYVTIQALVGGSSPSQAATATLTHALAYPHRRDATVRQVLPQPAGAARLFAVDAIAGDTTIFVNSLAGLATANQVEVSGGDAPVNEYHNVRRYRATSDADGYYRLPPISRVAQMRLEASDGVHTPVVFDYRTDYTSRENRLDFTFR